MIVNSKRAQE